MKKSLCLVIATLCLMIQPLAATSHQGNGIDYVIEHDMVQDSQPILVDIHVNNGDVLSPSETYHSEINIHNHLSYDLQLQKIEVHTNDALQEYVNISFDTDTMPLTTESLDTHISAYNQSQSTVNQYLQQWILQQRMIANQTQKFSIDYQLDTTYSNVVSFNDIHLQFQFVPIMMKGYIFKDVNHSGIQDEKDQSLADIPVKLWSGENLLATTSTDQNGYYQFIHQKLDQQSYIEVQKREGYNFTKVNNIIDKTNHIQCPLPSVLTSTQEWTFGLVEATYRIHYDKNDGQKNTLYKNESYTYQKEVSVLQGTDIYREGYIFEHWNTQPDGKGQVMNGGDIFQMPSHDMTLYAIWKEKAVISTSPPQQHASLFEVETSDDTHVLILSLMCLSGLGGMIVTKSLKKKENR